MTYEIDEGRLRALQEASEFLFTETLPTSLVGADCIEELEEWMQDHLHEEVEDVPIELVHEMLFDIAEKIYAGSAQVNNKLKH